MRTQLLMLVGMVVLLLAVFVAFGGAYQLERRFGWKLPYVFPAMLAFVVIGLTCAAVWIFAE